MQTALQQCPGRGWGGLAQVSRVRTRGYALGMQGLRLSWNNRWERSFDRQRFDTRSTLAPVHRDIIEPQGPPPEDRMP